MDSYTPWIAGAMCGLIAGLMVLVNAWTQRPMHCSECGAALPRIRQPGNRRQLLWGGWTCPRCGADLDRHGHKIEHRHDLRR